MKAVCMFFVLIAADGILHFCISLFIITLCCKTCLAVVAGMHFLPKEISKLKLKVKCTDWMQFSQVN